MTEEGRALAIVLGVLMGATAVAIALGFYTWRARRLERLAQTAAASAAAQGQAGAAGGKPRRRRPLGERR